jgi:CubicO group peptidase (beta-lactamase class C family)
MRSFHGTAMAGSMDSRGPMVLPLRGAGILAFVVAPTMALVVALCCPVPALAADAAPSRHASMQAALDTAIEREHAAARFDGVVLVGRDDSVIYERAIGLADRRAGLPHRVDEPWRLASVSKQVAALLTLRQVERGRFTLDTRLDALLPDFKSPIAAQVTVRHLLLHLSGLPNLEEDVIRPLHLESWHMASSHRSTWPHSAPAVRSLEAQATCGGSTRR